MGEMWLGWLSPHVLGEVVPDETGSTIRLCPPIELNSEKEVRKFAIWISDYCWLAFRQQIEPQVIDASGWREGLPAGI